MQARYVYYKVPRARLAEACTAVRAAQQAWTAREPGLQAQLLLRQDEFEPAGTTTLMEIWTWSPHANGSAASAARWASVEDALCVALGDALIGERHVEVFGPAPG